MLKTLFVLEISKFLSWPFFYAEKQLDKKTKSNFKIIAPQIGQRITTIHVLPNISRRKGSLTIKFGQLIEYNKRNISLGKSHLKCGGKASHRPFSKKLKWKKCLDQQSEML